MTKIILKLLPVFLIFTVIVNCSKKEKPVKINLEKKEIVKTNEVLSNDKTIRVAVGGMITPREGYDYYRILLDYIGEKLNKHVDFVDRESYTEINEMKIEL